MTPRRRRRPGTAAALLALVLVIGGALASARAWLPTHDAADSVAIPATPATGRTTDPAGKVSGPAQARDAAAATTASRPAPSAADPGAAATLRTLATIPVKGRAPATGYDRTGDFGAAWLDVDHNGCDTRDDVLSRDLTDVVRRGACTVTGGTLVSPYTGDRIAFVRGRSTSALVQIDHVVALENAWTTGAQQLTRTEREALANDPDNLFAVDGRSNTQKGSGDAATWLPASKAFRCTYVGHQVTVKARYRLWVTPAEHDAMVRVLDRC